MNTSRERVLIVDDEPQVLLALEDLLSEQFEVLKSESPERALALVERESDIAVVISDQRMPSMNGDEFLSRMRLCSEATGILLTGFADISAIIRAINSGRVFAYITKPWDSDDLRFKVQRGIEHFRLCRELAYERQLLHDLMDNVPDGIFFKDRDLRFVRVNRAYAEIMKAQHPDAFVGKRLEDVVGSVEDAALIEAEEQQVLSVGVSTLEPTVERMRPYALNGMRRWFSVSKAPIRSMDGNTLGLVGIARDVTDRRGQDESIARLTRVRAVSSGINAAIVRTDDPKVLLEESCRIAVEVGDFSMAVVAGVDSKQGFAHLVAARPLESPAILAIERELATGDSALGSALQSLLRTERPVIINSLADAPETPFRGELLRHGVRAVALFPLLVKGTVKSVFGLLSDRRDPFDVEEIKLLTELADNLSYAFDHIEKTLRLDFLAYHDELTGLPNRTLLLDRMSQQIAAAQRNQGKVAVLLIDIGRLRQVNETLGRSGGDALLLELARRLELALPSELTLARFESSAFAVLVPAVVDEADVAVLVQSKILQVSRDPFVVDSVELRISIKVGIALFPADAETGDTLLAKAESALKNAKARAQNYLFYAATMNERVVEKLTLETKLRRAIDAQEFVLHYQPKVELKTGNIVGLEALIRWRDPGSGLVPPGRFIPLLEETGMILEVGRWALERAAAQYGEWSAAGLKPPRIAVNVSAVQLASPDFVDTLYRILDRSASPSGGIDLEITESVFMENLADSVEKLQAARQRGMQVAVDDFGTGYSSLGYLTRLPIDALKIDRSFVVGMADDPQEMAIVTAIISLAHSMDLKVIAEGVETLAQARLLRLIKCNELQGYLVSKPRPPEEIPALLETKLELLGSLTVANN